MKKKTMYMHTIDGKPARYDGEQICFVRFYGNFIGNLVPSLKQIKKEQRLSNKWRRKQGFFDEKDLISPYGWIRVETEQKE